MWVRLPDGPLVKIPQGGGQYRDDDQWEDAPHFILTYFIWKNLSNRKSQIV